MLLRHSESCLRNGPPAVQAAQLFPHWGSVEAWEVPMEKRARETSVSNSGNGRVQG